MFNLRVYLDHYPPGREPVTPFATKTALAHRTYWPAEAPAARDPDDPHHRQRAIVRPHNSPPRTTRRNPGSCKDGYSAFHTSSATRSASSASGQSTATASATANGRNS